MGKYININSKGNTLGNSFDAKLTSLIMDGAKEVDPPTEWVEGLVCLIDNGHFAAAGYAYNEDELNEFLDISPDRETQWFIYEHASKLAM